MLRVVALVAGLTTALPAIAGEMSASEARQFVIERLFSYAFGADGCRKLPWFDRRIELRLLRLHTGAHDVGELKGASLLAASQPCAG